MNKVSMNEKRFKHFKLMLYGVTKKQKRVSRLETVVKSYEDRIRLLENNSIDLEARSRRNNIFFYGLAKHRIENCMDIINQFIADQFDIVVEQNAISRAHHIGRYRGNDNQRPVIVAFQEYTLSERISKLGYMLRDTKFKISLDHPREITCARKTLLPDLKQAKALNSLAKVTILYPAKLVVNGRVVKDLFPEWDSYHVRKPAGRIAPKPGM